MYATVRPRRDTACAISAPLRPREYRLPSMSELKTKPGTASVKAFLAGIADDTRRQDAQTVSTLMKQATKAEPRMWGTAIVGFGDFHYKYASGREGDWFVAGFSPRKQYLVLYLVAGIDRYKPLLARLGKHSRGKGCLYVKSLSDVDLGVLKTLIEQSVKDLKVIEREKKKERA